MGCPPGPGPQSGRVFRCAPQALVLALAFAAGQAAPGDPPAGPAPPNDGLPGGRQAQVTVEPVKTSIYIGSVHLAMPPFAWRNGVYSADYTATVFPYFFYNEHGRVAIEFSGENLRQLLRGETVYF